ncbi:MAG: hypothetical protein AAFU61_17610, partial [Pseudomonadota bacterium]
APTPLPTARPSALPSTVPTPFPSAADTAAVGLAAAVRGAGGQGTADALAQLQALAPAVLAAVRRVVFGGASTSEVRFGAVHVVVVGNASSSPAAAAMAWPAARGVGALRGSRAQPNLRRLDDTGAQGEVRFTATASMSAQGYVRPPLPPPAHGVIPEGGLSAPLPPLPPHPFLSRGDPSRQSSAEAWASWVAATLAESVASGNLSEALAEECS